MTGMGGDIQRSYADTERSVHYWEIGEGPALILFHQSGQTSQNTSPWTFIADDYRVIAIDLPNHGQSDTSDHELTMDEYADSVIDVMDNIGVDGPICWDNMAALMWLLTLVFAIQTELGKLYSQELDGW
ncbi:MAG: hypothetical protein CM1200mP17_06650 [Woeseia sp.]|nr:MAG: hypothetical protein CM1200mP17_06650 [Woeseia sp.]